MKTIPMIITYGLKDDMSADTITKGEIQADGKTVAYNTTIDIPENLNEAISELGGEDAVFAIVLRQFKVDFGNITRAKIQGANGHSTRPVMSEEQKAQQKLQRAKDRDTIAKLKTLDKATLQKLGINL